MLLWKMSRLLERKYADMLMLIYAGILPRHGAGWGKSGLPFFPPTSGMIHGVKISTIPHYKDVFVEISSLICFV